jgi:hypothetical protein
VGAERGTGDGCGAGAALGMAVKVGPEVIVGAICCKKQKAPVIFRRFWRGAPQTNNNTYRSAKAAREIAKMSLCAGRAEACCAERCHALGAAEGPLLVHARVSGTGAWTLRRVW